MTENTPLSEPSPFSEQSLSSLPSAEVEKKISPTLPRPEDAPKVSESLLPSPSFSLSPIQKKRLYAVLGGVAFLLFLILLQSGALTRGRVAPGTIPLPSSTSEGRTLTVEEVEEPVFYKAVGTIRSRTEIEISSRLVARITEVLVRSGDRVQRGDLLVRLDSADLLSAVAMAKEKVEAARSRVEEARQAMESAQARLTLAEKELQRVQKLHELKIASSQQFDEVTSAHRQAVAAMRQAEQAHRSASVDVLAAEAAWRQAEALLADATIQSPVEAIVGERLADPGDLATPGKILLRLFDPKKLLFEAPIREGLVKQVHLGDTLSLEIPSLGQQIAGELREIVPSVDPGSRTFLVKVCIGENPQLIPGMFATLQLPLGKRKTILLPPEAILRVGQLEYVQVIANNQRRLQVVRTRPASNNQREIVSGFSPGTVILLP